MTLRLMPSCGNDTSWLSNPHPEPNVLDNHHSASRTFTTNQPSLAGARPEPESSSRASSTGRVYGRPSSFLPQLSKALRDRVRTGHAGLLAFVQERSHSRRESAAEFVGRERADVRAVEAGASLGG